MAETTYTIQSRPPIRAFVIAALSALVGAGLLVLAGAQGWHVAVSVVGWVLLGVGVLLCGVAVVAMRRHRVRLILDDEGYVLAGQDLAHTGKWLDVNQVTLSEAGSHVTIYHGPERRTHLLFEGADAAQIDAVLKDLTARLKASRRR